MLHYPVRFLLVKKEQTWTCQLLSGKLYHNHKLVSEATFPLAFGDELAIGDVTLSSIQKNLAWKELLK